MVAVCYCLDFAHCVSVSYGIGVGYTLVRCKCNKKPHLHQSYQAGWSDGNVFNTSNASGNIQAVVLYFPSDCFNLKI